LQWLFEAMVTGRPPKETKVTQVPYVLCFKPNQKRCLVPAAFLISALRVLLLLPLASQCSLPGSRQIQCRNISGSHRLIERGYVRGNKLFPCCDLLVKLAAKQLEHFILLFSGRGVS
jgi:hypothetical protein